MEETIRFCVNPYYVTGTHWVRVLGTIKWGTSMLHMGGYVTQHC